MANSNPRRPFILDQSIQQQAQLWVCTYQDGETSIEDPNIEGPQIPKGATTEVLCILWKNFTHRISDRRIELTLQHVLQE